MKNRTPLAALTFLLGLSVPSSVFAQGVLAPPALVDVNEAVYYYIQGDAASYEKAIELLSSAVTTDPNNAPALLFRALSQGRLGLLERNAKLDAENRAATVEEILGYRVDGELLPKVEREIEELRAALEATDLDPTERVLKRMRLEDQLLVVNMVAETKDNSAEELRESQRVETVKRQEAAGRERERYRAMSADLDRLIKVLNSPEVVIQLLKVISQSKIARLDEEEALGIRRGEIAVEDASGPVSALRSSARDILKDTARLLESMRGGLSGEDAVRTDFFLGVIRYRLAIPRRSEDESPQIDYKLLRQSEQVMAELADDAGISATWRSYASLYLGLIIPFRASVEPDPAARAGILDEAEQRLRQAAVLDTITHPEGEPDSASRGSIPFVVWRQREEIERLRTAPPAAPPKINDIQLTLYSGVHRDTNLVLLGENTALPRDISDESDFGFTAGLALDYTYTLAERWTLGVQGRVSELWHCDVDEFDEQRYGGSLAVQYEALEQEGTFGPVYLRLQYDYDYTLLGRSAFLDSQVISPNLLVEWADRHAETSVYFSYGIRDYHEDVFDRRFNRDGTYLALGMLQSFDLVDMTSKYESWGVEPWGHEGDEYLRQVEPDFPARYLTPFLSVQYAWDNTDGDEYDQKEITLRSGVAAPLPYGLELDATAEFQWQKYRNASLIDYHRRHRRDFVQRYEIGLSRTFVLRGGEMVSRYTPVIDRVLMTLRAHATFTHDDSNVVDRLGEAIFSYDRTLYGLSVAFTFN